METLASMSYTDGANSPATHPTVPTTIAIEVVDPTETCGIPSVTLGKQNAFGMSAHVSICRILVLNIYCSRFY